MRGRDLTRHAEHAQEVGAVRLDLDVEDGVVQAERRLDVVADAQALAVVEDQDPLVGVGDLSSRGEQSMPLDITPRSLRGASGSGRTGHARPGLRPRHEVAGGEVADAGTDDLLAGAVVHPRDAELVGVRVVA